MTLPPLPLSARDLAERRAPVRGTLAPSRMAGILDALHGCFDASGGCNLFLLRDLMHDPLHRSRTSFHGIARNKSNRSDLRRVRAGRGHSINERDMACSIRS